MTTSSVTWTEEMVEVAGSRIKLVKGGSGDPLLILHDEMGHPGWLRWHEALAQNHTLYIPWHPGFGESAELDWVMNLHDLAIWYLGALDDLGLEGRGRHRLFPGRLAGRGNGGDVPPAVQAAGPGRRRRRPAPHRRNLRHLPGGSQGLHQPLPAGPGIGRRVPGHLPRRAHAGTAGKLGDVAGGFLPAELASPTCTTRPCPTCCPASSACLPSWSGAPRTPSSPSAPANSTTTPSPTPAWKL